MNIKLKDTPITHKLNEYGKLNKPVLHPHILCVVLHQSHQMRVLHHHLLSQSVSDSLSPEVNTSSFNNKINYTTLKLQKSWFRCDMCNQNRDLKNKEKNKNWSKDKNATHLNYVPIHTITALLTWYPAERMASTKALRLLWFTSSESSTASCVYKFRKIIPNQQIFQGTFYCTMSHNTRKGIQRSNFNYGNNIITSHNYVFINNVQIQKHDNADSKVWLKSTNYNRKCYN